jgi:hypothetical protein
MPIPSYQMHNVLNVYSKKLRHNLNVKDQNISEKPPANRANVTSEGKRQATIEKVSKEIFEKIIRISSQSELSFWKSYQLDKESEQLKEKMDKESASTKTKKVGFVYNVIDTINKKTTNTVSVEDSSFLIQRLERLSKDTMEMKKRNTGFEENEEIDNPITWIHRVEESLCESVDNG